MMCWPLLVASFLAAEVQAFAPAPLRWGGISAKRFVLASSVSPNTAIAQSRAVTTPHKLAIWDQELPSTMVVMELPYFMPQPDKTIAWHGTGLCIEATGGSRGDAVSVNKCTGESTQLWNILPSGKKHMNQFQLKGTNECIDVHGKEGDLNGAPVELQKCDDTSAKAWEFEAALPIPTPNSTHRHPSLHSMRNAVFPLMGMAVLGALSVAAWLWQGRTRHVAAQQDNSPSISGAGVRRIPAVMMELRGTWEEKIDQDGVPYWTNIETEVSTSVRPTSGVIPKKQEAPKAPPPSGWIEKFDKATGAPYWVNLETDVSTEVRPTSSVGTTRPEEHARMQRPKQTQEAAPVDSRGGGGIWEERIDQDGVPYWTNNETEVSTSVRPTSGVIPKKQEEPTPDPPSGWIEKFDHGTGAPYWVDTSSGLSTSVRPTSPVS